MSRDNPARMTAEVALAGFHLAVVASFGRVYSDGSFWWPLAGMTVGAHLLAAAARRARWRSPLVAVLEVAGWAVAIGIAFLPATTSFGLPTPETWSSASDAIARARADFAIVEAPTPVQTGFQIGAASLLWLAAWFADWAAFRLRATIEALAPGAVIFVFLTLLGSGRHQVSSAAGFVAAALLFVAAHRTWRHASGPTWLAEDDAAGPRSLVRVGAVGAAVAVLAGSLLAPALPGAGDDALWNWRGRGEGDGPRVTVSPMVELKKRLVEQSDRVLFEVTSQEPAYWRMTSMGQFDGELFGSSADYSPAGSDLPTVAGAEVDSGRFEQAYSITALDTLWAPTAYRATGLVSSSAAMSWDGDSSTLIVDDELTSSNGLAYTVVSASPIQDPAALLSVGLGSGVVDDVAAEYEDLPADLPREVSRLAREVTDGAEGRYDQVIALQRWFRNSFTYSLRVPSSHDESAISEFLRSREGYCEQFSATFAVMARTLGIPSRVAVGFTQGEPKAGSPKTYVVRGLHAHAWPEVWFPGAGWVPFEPTPGRGMPGAEAITGVTPQQAAGNGGLIEQTTTTVASAPGDTSTTAPSSPTTAAPAATTTTSPPPSPASSPPGTAGSSGGTPWPALAAALVGFAALWLGLVLGVPALRRIRRLASTRDPVDRSWSASLDPVRALTGLWPTTAETQIDFARRAAPDLGSAASAFGRLAELATTSAWSTTPVSAATEAEAESLAVALATHAKASASADSRLRHRLSWRRLVDRHP